MSSESKTDWERFVTPKLPELVKKLKPSSLLEELRANDLISAEDCNTLRHDCSTEEERSRKLLYDMLPYKGDDVVDRFRQILLKVQGQAHIAKEVLQVKIVSKSSTEEVEKTPQQKEKLKQKEVTQVSDVSQRYKTEVKFSRELDAFNISIICGRQKELDEIEAKLWGDKDEHSIMRRILFVSGHGGVGKTRLIAKYAQQFRNSYTGGVYLFDAQSILSFHQSLKINMRQIANVTYDSSVDWDLVSDYNYFLQQLDITENALFVYDSCDNLQVIEMLIPAQAKHIHVIVTTRARGGHVLLDANRDRVVHVDVLEKNDAVEALMEWKENGQSVRSVDDDVKEKSGAEILVNLPQIGRLPLAIRHAGLYLREKKISCDEFGELLDNRKEKLRTIGNDVKEIVKYCGLQHVANALEEEGMANVRDFVQIDLSRLQTSFRIRPHELEQLGRMKEKLKTATVMTWDMQIEEIMKNSDAAISTILEIASLIDGKMISKRLLLNIANFNEWFWKRIKNEAISRLSNVSLLNDDVECSMHGLVQQNVVEAMLREGTFARRLRLLCKCLVDMLPRSWDGVVRSLKEKKVLELVDHVYVLSSHILQSEQLDEECWRLLQVSCWIAGAYGHLKKAEHLCEGRLALVKRLDSQQMDKNKLLTSLIAVGRVRMKLSNPQEAESPLKEALEMSRECGGQIEPRIHYRALSSMAACYNALRQFETSEQLYLELLKFVEQQGLGQEYVYVVLNDLAVTYDRWGNISAAIENYEKGLSLMRKQSNVNPLNLSTGITNLASRYEENGQLERAVSYYEEALTIIRKELPPSHPSLAWVMSGLSYCYRQQDRMDHAMPLANEALQRASSSLPINHAELGYYLQEVASCHRESRSYDEAIRLYERAADVFSHHLPARATSLSIVKHNLSLVYNDIEQKDKAVELMTESLNIERQTLPEKHPSIAQSLVTLGGILRSKGDFDEAVVHIESGVSILQEKLPTSPFIANGLYHLAFIEMKRNQLVEAHGHATGCLRIRQQIFSNKHRKIVEAQTLLREIDKKQQ